MKKILRDHPNTLLASLAIFFLAVVIVCFAYGIGYIIVEVNKANNEQIAPSEDTSFNLAGAAALDYRGLPN